ncbi:hypothetical protein [Mucilaginibacter inviolabilis]|uniref:hypothetical protein n=1 Tax=Mucilaginibacter inviolabilis TaxID=2714892 RepID=UPI00140D13CE|nr:hypothetical protein [Mucilaginibacter inviolabilis]
MDVKYINAKKHTPVLSSNAPMLVVIGLFVGMLFLLGRFGTLKVAGAFCMDTYLTIKGIYHKDVSTFAR